MINRQRGRKPVAAPERGTLYLSCSDRSTTTKLQVALEQGGLRVAQCDDAVLATQFSIRTSRIWNRVLSNMFTSGELATVKCRLLPVGVTPSSAEFMQSEDLAAFLGWLEGRWLVDLLAADGLFSVFQPIVHADEPQRVFAYEGLIRGRLPDGNPVSPDRLFSAAKSIGLSADLDCAARIKAIQTAAQRRISARIFVNINVNSIFDPQRCLASTIAAARASGLCPEQFVFEVVESEEIADPEGLLRVLELFRENGFGVALDDVGAGYASLNLLVRVKPDFMKLDMGLIRNVDRDRYKGHVAAKLLELARELNAHTVVEGVETIGEWQWAREHGADFAQGYLFAAPAEKPPLPRVPDWPMVPGHLPPEHEASEAIGAIPAALS
jgi:EAL domain-containing protein (putative c-di-GMP-specific phosphodiesterase class I)